MEATPEIRLATGPCAGKSQADCTKLAMQYQYGDNKDPALALTIYLAQCNAGLVSACTDAAELTEDPVRKRALFEQGCVAPAEPGCMLFAYELADSDEKHDRDEALALFERACAAGHGPACLKRGEKDPVVRSALSWYRKGCVLGEERACGHIAFRLVNDKDPDRDPVQSTKELERMCEAGSGVACEYASQRHFEGKGAPRASREESLRWWRIGCEQAKEAALCYALGRWYAHNGRTTDERELGVRYLDLGCVGEHQSSCELLDSVKAKIKSGRL